MTDHLRSSSIVRELRQRLRQMDKEAGQAGKPASRSAPNSTGIAALDALLSAGTFRAGMIVEWIVEGAGAGAARLALPMAIESLQHGGALVVIDDRREFYPPAAERLGVDLERTIVVHPRTGRETIWTLEQALRCAGVAATWSWIEKIPDRVFRRLQLAAEHGGRLGLFMRPAAARSEPTWADLRWLVQPLPSRPRRAGLLPPLSEIVSLSERDLTVISLPLDGGGPGWGWERPSTLAPHPDPPPRRGEGESVQRREAQSEAISRGGEETSSGRRLRVELLHCRGGTGGGAVSLEISDETGAVRVVPPLAAPASLSRAAGA